VPGRVSQAASVNWRGGKDAAAAVMAFYLI
jgi:hypothetical protein